MASGSTRRSTSVRQQTFQDFEIVIVDDGSTDAATVRKLESIDAPGTRVLRTENRGLPAARNHAAAQARGELFCALDADDRLAATWFEKGNALLEVTARDRVRLSLARDVRRRALDVEA